MARRRIRPEELPAAIAKIISDYGKNVDEGAEEVVRKVAKRSTEALKSSSASVINDNYARGWTYEVEAKRLNTVATIYHKNPGLPHLLEHGHAMPRGGRAPARVHIAPIADAIDKEYEKDMEAMIHDI